jgi:predicted RNA binding protein YcfA (HicA-like mRNA interferase family)
VAKLTPRPTNRVLRALKRAGWIQRRPAGKRHYVLVNEQLPGIVTVPRHPVTKKGTLRSIIEQAHLTPDEFERFYR